MADEKQDQQEQQQGQEQTGSGSSAGTGTAVKAVAAAAATGAAALAAKKMISGRSSNGQPSNGDSPQKQDQGGESILSSALSGGWEAARDALLPAAEDAAGAAGEYVAQHGPDILRERIIPRFVDSFNEARGSS